MLQLGLQAFQKRKGVGGGPGKAGDDMALAQAAHLARIALDDGLAQRNLAVARDHHLGALADGEDRGAVPVRKIRSVLGHGHST